ncbi:MAG: phosphohistidine phosphatase [Pseudohongiellaceae bacterium]|jgi:phosphohistidine phosphatase
MKNLFLLRHAKSSWDNPDLKDFERPLNQRGLADIPVMAARFTRRNCSVSSIICSPALRTKTTALLFSEALNYSGDTIISNPGLYFAGVGMFLKATTLIDDDCDSALLVGHNPAITEFVNAMANVAIDNIPTCGLVHLQLDIDTWSQAELGLASMLEFDYPKKLD